MTVTVTGGSSQPTAAAAAPAAGATSVSSGSSGSSDSSGSSGSGSGSSDSASSSGSSAAPDAGAYDEEYDGDIAGLVSCPLASLWTLLTTT